MFMIQALCIKVTHFKWFILCPVINLTSNYVCELWEESLAKVKKKNLKHMSFQTYTKLFSKSLCVQPPVLDYAAGVWGPLKYFCLALRTICCIYCNLPRKKSKEPDVPSWDLVFHHYWLKLDHMSVLRKRCWFVQCTTVLYMAFLQETAQYFVW